MLSISLVAQGGNAQQWSWADDLNMNFNNLVVQYFKEFTFK